MNKFRQEIFITAPKPYKMQALIKSEDLKWKC